MENKENIILERHTSRLITIIKIIVSGIIAFLLLNFFSVFYYNIPTRIASSTKSTDYRWEESKFYIRGTEGFSYGRTDENGFNNLEVIENPDVLVMGSSQMEGFNVLQHENTTYKLNELFKKDGINLTAYNIGVSGHFKERCFNNLQNAVNEFSPKKYVVIEINDTKFNMKDLLSLTEGSYVRLESSDTGILYQLQKFDYLRLLYSQFKSFKGNSDETVKEQAGTDMYTYDQCLETLIKKAVSDSGDCQLIILYNKGLILNGDSVQKQEKDYYYNSFKDICEENDVVFIDMYDAFADYYKSNSILPNGFSNTHVGRGHLNKYGHSIIAEKLYNTILEMECNR